MKVKRAPVYYTSIEIKVRPSKLSSYDLLPTLYCKQLYHESLNVQGVIFHFVLSSTPVWEGATYKLYLSNFSVDHLFTLHHRYLQTFRIELSYHLYKSCNC